MRPIIYEYGCRIDAECIALADEQINKARHLYNAIIAIIRDTRQKADDYIKNHDPKVAEKMVALDAANAALKLAKSANDEPRMKEAVEQRRAIWKEAAPLLKEARKTNKEAIAEIFSVIGRSKKEGHLTYIAREQAIAAGLGSNTADDILDTALKAWDKVRKDGGNLAFRSARDRQQDHISVRFSCAGGLEMDEFLGREHNMMSLKLPAEAKSKRYGDFKFRLGAAKAGNYATGTFQYHRPFPQGSTVTTIRLVRKRIGPDTRWALQFQLKVPDYQPITVKPARKKLAALHMGFNLSDEGYRRIGAIADHPDTGFATFIDMPDDIPFDLYRAEQIQSKRDINRDNIHAAMLSMTMRGYPAELEEEWQAIVKLKASYVSAARLVRLSRRMEAINPDSVASQQLREYAINDWKSYGQQRHIHVRALNRRKNYYRELALELVRNYENIVIGRMNLKDMALRIKDDGERNELGQIARHARHSVALYQFIECLKWAGTRADCIIHERGDLKYTATCSACGAEFIRETDEIVCECGHEADVKANSAANLYAQSLPTVEQDAEAVRQSLADKAQKAAVKKEEKIKRMQDKRRLALETSEILSGVSV